MPRHFIALLIALLGLMTATACRADINRDILDCQGQSPGNYGIGIEQNRAEAVKWFTRASSQGDGKAAYFAKFLSDPTNFIGFRNRTEHDYVMDRLRYAGDFIGGDPNRAFASSKERDEFLIAFKASATFHEAQAQWGVRHNNYQACLGNGGGSTCRNPGPPPAIR